jgi:hypothetical protein
MRKLIIWMAAAVTLISVAGAATAPALLGETSIVAPIVTDEHEPAVPGSNRGHVARHAHLPLFTS